MSKLKRLKESLKSKKDVVIDYTPSDEYIELKEKPTDKQTNIYLRYCVLDSFEDVKAIMDFMREGYSVCVVKIKALKDKDINELKRAISKIKKVCEVMNGDVVGMDEDYLIASPSFVKVTKGYTKDSKKPDEDVVFE